ncbi:NUDIX hydrolase [Conchiformibius kuhniae]|uniref:NUDIX hydrolase n=1 Tax=Conchiformibius kuhniae TaxID=211502 RepID=A0A8T9MRI9_9NEIS|nr:CoA pyrophosphatase [Conchiformibius kuhniae]UOP04510.1 CoA pyrophosphatase [Conchiformibius kuhniae]
MNAAELARFLDFCCRAPHGVALLVSRNRLFDFDAPKAAAVLVAFAPDAAGEWWILLTRRADTLRHHGGQFAFAGGRVDAADGSAAAAALREAAEEVGTPPDVWTVAGSLPECHTPSGYAVTPVLAHAPTLPVLQPNAAEVAETFWLPVRTALNPNAYRARPFAWRGQRFHSPALHWQGREIWGATALILRHLAACYARFKPNTML